MELDPEKQRTFAVDVARRLTEAGFVAYWAGGCVRDQLLGRAPKDYDVATNALPDQVRRLFGFRRTHAVGAAFGVITVTGVQGAGHVEVATFRRDAKYSDGRHPDAVEFSTPAEDASRRDFTINGLFYDPQRDEVIDLVGGREDLARGIVRAIGDPHARLAEDKLRMLRGVRFAATFGFELDGETRAAVASMAHEISAVSAERIAQEMRLLLVLSRRTAALDLLRETNLLKELLPELAVLTNRHPSVDWQETLRSLKGLDAPSFPLALAVALHRTEPSPGEAAAAVAARWKLSNKEAQRIGWLVRQQRALSGAETQAWSRLQRVLIEPGIDELLALYRACYRDEASGGDLADLDLAYCHDRLALPPEKLNPLPLVNGNDLIKHGLQPGAAFQTLLEKIRDAQLEGRVNTRDEALALASSLAATGISRRK